MTPEALRAARDRLAKELGIPVVLPLEEGVAALLPVVREYLAAETGR
jgi:hypothetical protein